MDVGGFLLGVVVASAVAKVLWDKEKAKHNAVLNTLKQELYDAEESADKEETPPVEKASAPKAKKSTAASKKSPAKKKASAEDVEGKIKDAVSKLKDAGEKITLAAVSRESGISYSRIKRQKELVEKYK